MNLSDAASLATTIGSYFSPTRSPFYPIVAISIISLELSAGIRTNWWIFYLPIAIVLLISTLLSFSSHPEFKKKEYKDQIRFARACTVSAAVLGLAGLGKFESKTNLITWEQWDFWFVYVAGVAQAAVLMMYTYIYNNRALPSRGLNFVQLALITSSYLLGAAYAAVAAQPGKDEFAFKVTLVTILMGWSLCMLLWMKHLRDAFRTRATPAEATSKTPSTTKVVSSATLPK